MDLNPTVLLTLLSQLSQDVIEADAENLQLRNSNTSLNTELIQLRAKYTDAVSRIAPSKRGPHEG